jgi:hypothetical protein
MTIKKTLNFAWKLILVIICLLFLGFILQMFFPAGFATKATESAGAVLSYPEYTNELPDKVEITIDETKAVFCKNTKPYNDLLIFIQKGRSSEAIEKAGSPPQDIFGKICGEMKITSFGIPFHFEIRRSNENTNYYRIILPKLTSPGRSLPIFTADPHIINFIEANKIQ